jgi:probable LLM family oxidoreductase
MELGVYTFADLGTHPDTLARISPEARHRNLIEEAVLAEQVGLDVFGVGEHHRPDFAVSAPAVVLAAVAVRTSRIRLTTAVTVLGSEDPVRAFQEMATVDLLSGGRAEIMAGRGSFIESFPLFGVDMADYDAVFSEKLSLLLALRERERITWTGTSRPPIDGLGVYPRPVQVPLPIWLAVGGTPASAVRAAELGLPMALAIIGGQPARFRSFVDLFRDAQRRAGRAAADLPLSINSQGYVAATSQQAADEFFPSLGVVMNTIGRERGWPPMGRRDLDAMRGPTGALVVGSPDEVAEKILYEHEIFGHQRFLAQMSIGPIDHQRVLRSIELFGTRVAPQVRRALANATALDPAPAGETARESS